MPTLPPAPTVSPYTKTKGLVWFARMLHKARLHAAGQLGPDYLPWVGKGFDGRCLRLLKIEYPALLARVALPGTDEEILEWAFINGRQPTDEEILIFNEYMVKRGIRDTDNPGQVEGYKEKNGFGGRTDIETYFDVIESDEGRPLLSRALTPPAALAKRIFQRAHLTGSFKLRSGAVSTEYFDKYRFEGDPALLKDIAAALTTRIASEYDALAGLEMGGIPIATMLSQFTGKPALFIRKQAKEYGTCLFAEGGEVRGRRLLLVEDVVTSGGQILESAAALRKEGAIITHVVCVIDREAGGKEALAKAGLSLTSLFTMSELKRAAE